MEAFLFRVVEDGVRHKTEINLVKTLLIISVSLFVTPSIFADAVNQRYSINFAPNPSSVAQLEFYHILVSRFERQYPQVDVHINSQMMESHKQRVADFNQGNTQDIDVMLAFAGTQLESLIRSGHIAAIDEVWFKHDLDNVFPYSTKQMVSIEGQPFAIPLAYYQWGFYYRKSFFQRWGLSEPENWEQFLATIQQLATVVDSPLNFSGANPWTTLAWFDYLSLRLLGREYYLELMAGSRSFNTPEVANVFEHWQQLIQAGAFDPVHKGLSWQQSLPFFYRGKTALMLQGNFFLADAPESLLSDIGFFPFPRMIVDMPNYEIAPMDTVVMASHAKDKPFVKEFLVFLSLHETQTFFSEYVDVISPRSDYQPNNNYLLQVGAELLHNADGLVQYFDRETDPEFTRIAGETFVTFMSGEITVEMVLTKLESARQMYLLKPSS